MSKDTHIYQRMNDPRIVKGYIKMLRESDIDTANKLFLRIKNEASDHYRFNDIQAIYQDRLDNTEK